MDVLIIISSDNPEIRWNAVRFGNFLLNEGEDVSIFLNGPGTALYEGDSDTFPIREQAKMFALSEGELQACGKCMDLHGVEEDEYLKRSNMINLYALVKKADRVINY